MLPTYLPNTITVIIIFTEINNSKINYFFIGTYNNLYIIALNI